jgi:hypothetical protein
MSRQKVNNFCFFIVLFFACSLDAENAQSEFLVQGSAQSDCKAVTACCPKKKASKKEMAQLREDVVDQAIECMETIHKTTQRRVSKVSVDAGNISVLVSLSEIGLELVGLSRQLVNDERNSFVAKADEQTLRALLEILVAINNATDKDFTVMWVCDQEKKIKKICCSDILNSK